jgi:hypothetical protein
MNSTGPRGEAAFKHLCHSSETKHEVNLNNPTNDLHGWDYLVEITPKVSDAPADLQTQVVQCLAQIKSTNTKGRTVRLKLSNALKAAQAPYPSFIFLLAFTDNHDIPSVYGRHVWSNEIEDWLRRAREHSTSGARRLHKQEVKLKFLDSEIITTSPSDWMLNQVASIGINEYAKEKTRLVETVGYGKIRKTGTLRIGPITSEQDLALHEIGIIDSLPLDQVEIFDQRFGINAASPEMNFGSGGTIKLRKEPVKIRLKVESSGGEVSSCEALLIASTLLGPKHPEARIRISTEIVDIIFKPNSNDGKTSINFNFEKRSSIERLTTSVDIWQWLSLGDIEISIFSDQGRLHHSRLLQREAKVQSLEVEQQALRHAIDLIDKDKLARVECSLSEIRDLISATRISAPFSTAPFSKITSEFDGTVENFDYALFYTYGSINEWAFGVMYSSKVREIQRHGSSHHFSFDTMKAYRSFFFKTSLENIKRDLIQEFENWRDSFSCPTAIVMDGDLRKLAATLNDNKVIDLDVRTDSKKSRK